MLKAIKIQNFQSHENTVLKFDKGINVICGISQAGKTAILRAINFVLYNRPLGFRYHSLFAKKEHTQVDLYTDDGHKITHYKTETEDKYTQKTHGGVNRWKKVNKEVPDLVVAALNMDTLNIHNQFDSPLLITSTPSEIAKTINKVTGIEKADKWKAKLTTKINDLNKEKRIIKGDIEETNEKLKAYENLDQVGKLIEKIKAVEKQIEGFKKEQVVIEGFLEVVSDRAELNKHYRPLKEIVDKMESIRVESIDLRGEKEALALYLNDIERLRQDKQEKDALAKDYTELMKKLGICPTCFGKIDDKTIQRIVEEL